MNPAVQAALDRLAAGMREYNLARKRLDEAAGRAAESLQALCDYLQEAEQREFIQAAAAFEQPIAISTPHPELTDEEIRAACPNPAIDADRIRLQIRATYRP